MVSLDSLARPGIERLPRPDASPLSNGPLASTIGTTHHEPLIAFSQGGVYRWKSGGFSESGDEGCACHTVPFLLGRAALMSLRAGEPVDVNVFGEVQTFTKKDIEKREVNVLGETKSIDAIHATSNDGDLWIVDDAKWPVVLHVETAGGDNYCKLQSISAESIEAVESTLD